MKCLGAGEKVWARPPPREGSLPGGGCWHWRCTEWVLLAGQGPQRGKWALRVEGRSEGPAEDLAPSPPLWVLPPDFLETAAGDLACTFAELAMFSLQLKVTMFPSGRRLPLPGRVDWFRAQEGYTAPTAAPSVSNHRWAHGCRIRDARWWEPTVYFLKTSHRQGSKHPPRVTHPPSPDTLTHTQFTQNHSTGEQRVFTRCRLHAPLSWQKQNTG